VPPGFTITTAACNAYYDAGQQFPNGLWDQAKRAMKDIEEKQENSSATRRILSWYRFARAQSSPCPA
jgi:phosphoenolpyruvate synthase/pyruvate phosphate dikinase